MLRSESAAVAVTLHNEAIDWEMSTQTTNCWRTQKGGAYPLQPTMKIYCAFLMTAAACQAPSFGLEAASASNCASVLAAPPKGALLAVSTFHDARNRSIAPE